MTRDEALAKAYEVSMVVQAFDKRFDGMVLVRSKNPGDLTSLLFDGAFVMVVEGWLVVIPEHLDAQVFSPEDFAVSELQKMDEK